MVPPASVANNNCKVPAISNFHCSDEDVNRASPSHKYSAGAENRGFRG
jgi:hypothetical protein